MGNISESLVSSFENLTFNFSHVESLFRLNHGLLHSLCLQHPKALLAEKICAEFSIFPKITGAGYGGCLIAVLAPNYSQVSELQSKLFEENIESYVVEIHQPGVRWTIR